MRMALRVDKLREAMRQATAVVGLADQAIACAAMLPVADLKNDLPPRLLVANSADGAALFAANGRSVPPTLTTGGS